jgi:RHS repeat-associated protein
LASARSGVRAAAAIFGRLQQRRRRATVLSMAVVLIVSMLPAGSLPGLRHAPAPANRPVASSGARPVDVAIPRGSQPRHGFAPGQLPPVLPPDLNVDDMAKAPAGAPVKAARVVPAALADPPRASNLVLVPGLVVGDTSLQLYFDAPATGWIQGTVSLFAEADPATTLHTATFTPAELLVCDSPATYCFTLPNSKGWGLTAAGRYGTRVTLTTADGNAADSDPSGIAAARALPNPPAVPPEQVRGGSSANSSGRTGVRPVLRGYGVNVATGAFTQDVVDLKMSSAFSVNVAARRTYSSSDTAPGLLGVGWRFGYEAHVTPKPDGSGAVFVAEDGTESAYTRNGDGSYAPPPGARSTLSSTPGGWALVTPDQRRLSFDAGGRLLSVLNTRGKGVTLAYGANGRLASVTDAGGRVLTVTTVDPGRISSVKLPDGRSVSYTYTNDRLTKVVDPDGATTVYGYDTGGRLVTVTDALGHKQLVNTYDPGSGRVTAQADFFGKVTMFTWDSGKQESTVTDPDQVMIRDGFKDNVLLFTQNGNGDSAVQRYDSSLNLQVVADGLGHQVEMSYDSRGNATTSTMFGGDPITESASFDDANGVLSQTNGRGKVSTNTYNEFHEVVAATDAEGHRTTFGYDPATGLLTSVTDPLGHTTAYGYDSAGNQTSVTDPNGARTTRTFDATGRVRSSTDPRGNVAGANPATFTTTYDVYDGRDRLRKGTDPLGHFGLWNYDNAGRLVSQTDGNGFVTSYEYDGANRLTKLIDSDLRTTTYGHTPGGRLATVTDGLGDVTSYGYNTAGRLVTEVAPKAKAPGADPTKFTTTYRYDANGNLTFASRPYPDGGTATVSYRYNALSELTAEVDPLGGTVKYGYDLAGNLTTVTDPLGFVSTAGYDGDNQRTSVTDPRGKTTTFGYDAAGNLVAHSSPGGAKTTYSYDPAGHPVGVTTPRGNVGGADPAAFTTRFGFDPAGNQISRTDPVGAVTKVDYDAAGRVVRQVDANGHAVRYTYDNANRLTRILGADATNDTQATVNNYDHAGHLIDRTNPLGFVERFTYDAAGRMVSSVDAVGNRREFTYDPDGNLATLVTGRGTSAGYQAGRDAGTIVFQYDTLDRLRMKALGTGPVYSYGYDGASRLTNLADPTGEQVRTFNAGTQLTGVTRGGTAFTYTYDPAGNVKTRTLPDGTTQTLDYDDDNRPSTLGAPVGTTTYGYDADSNLTSTTLPGGSTEDRSYDTADRLTGLTEAGPGGAALTAYTVARDKVGNPVRLDTTIGGTKRSDAFTYDAANRLTAMCFQTGTCSGATNKLSFGYDLVGNRLTRTKTGTGAFTERYTYNAADQLTSRSGGPDGTVTYDYDADGNTVRAGTVKSTYGLDNRVTGVDDGTRKTAYTDDAAGNRLFADTSPSSGGTATRTSYQWDVNSPLPMLVSEQTVGQTRSYTYHPSGQPLAQRVDGATSLLHPDPFGNTTALTDTAGTVQRRYTLTDPFGGLTPTSATGPDTRLGFDGQYSDPLSGAYHLRARDYAASSGRFQSVDPERNALGQPAESAYTYGGDNPLVGRDPSGRDWWDDAVNWVFQRGRNMSDSNGDGKTTAGDWLSNEAGCNHGGVGIPSNMCDGLRKLGDVTEELTKVVVEALAGLLAGAVCEAATGGGGSLVCEAIGSGVSSVAAYMLNTPQEQWTAGGFVDAFATGAVIGLGFGIVARGLGAIFKWVKGRFGHDLGDVPEVPGKTKAPDEPPAPPKPDDGKPGGGTGGNDGGGKNTGGSGGSPGKTGGNQKAGGGTSARPTNRAGQPYPNVPDPRTGNPIAYPGSGLTIVPKANRVPWGPMERAAYIKEWFNRGFGKLPGKWSDYDIHHIRPREYGGTNDFDNLVPIPRPVHQQQFNPWWQKY